MKRAGDEAPDGDTGRGQQGDGGRPRAAWRHMMRRSDSPFERGHGDEVLLQRGDEVVPQQAEVDDDPSEGEDDGR